MSQDMDKAALVAWLATHVRGFRGPCSIQKFPGGQSNPTYRIDAADDSYVLRRKPFGQLLPSAHAVEREYRLLSALWPLGFPVPKPLALCDDPSIVGTSFYVMELSVGQSRWDGSLPDLAPSERRTAYLAMVDTLATLHQIDVQAAGLTDFGRPGNYFERQIKRWTRQYREAQTDDIVEMEYLIDWLTQTIPSQTRSSVVHGDYRIDNLIFTAENKVAAVLDWELSTLGDPLADFSYFAMQWVLPRDGAAALGGLDLAALGVPTLGEIVDRYCIATNRDGLPDLDWHFSYNLFRSAGIAQGIKKRVADGTASNAKAHEIAAKAPFFAKTAWTFALKAQARDPHSYA